MQHNAKVYLAARGKEATEVVIQELKTITGREAIFLELDLASLPSVRKAAEEFLRCVVTDNLDNSKLTGVAFISKETDLHVLFNNA